MYLPLTVICPGDGLVLSISTQSVTPENASVSKTNPPGRAVICGSMIGCGATRAKTTLIVDMAGKAAHLSLYPDSEAITTYSFPTLSYVSKPSPTRIAVNLCCVEVLTGILAIVNTVPPTSDKLHPAPLRTAALCVHLSGFNRTSDRKSTRLNS